MLEMIFKSVLITSLVGTVLATVIMTIKKIAGRRFSCSWNYYIWLAVILVLILPVHISLPETSIANKTVTLEELLSANQAETLIDAEKLPSQAQIVNTDKSALINVLEFISDNIGIIAVIWLIVALSILAVKLLGYAIFLIKIHRHSEFISCPEIKEYTTRNVRTRVSEKICSPLIIGLIRPTLLLPKTDMTPTELNNILSHEMTHLRRNDVLIKWIVTFVKCMHWFNPASYLIARQINLDCEIACDYEVVKQMSVEEERNYIETILSLLVHNKGRTIPLTTGMAGDKKTLKRRFIMIKNKSKVSKRAIVLSSIIAVLLLTGSVFASGVLQEEATENPYESVVSDTVQTKDDGKIEIVNTENSTIEYEKETGEIKYAESHPELVTENKGINKVDAVEIVEEREETDPTKVEEREKNDLTKVAENNIAFIRPCEGEVTQGFGTRKLPVTEAIISHEGIDIKANEGTTVVSSIPGKVTDAGFDLEKGNYIVVEQGTVSTVYEHLKSSSVKKGDVVSAGQKIGEVGNTGNSTGAHLHFEIIFDGINQNPEKLFALN